MSKRSSVRTILFQGAAGDWKPNINNNYNRHRLKLVGTVFPLLNSDLNMLQWFIISVPKKPQLWSIGSLKMEKNPSKLESLSNSHPSLPTQIPPAPNKEQSSIYRAQKLKKNGFPKQHAKKRLSQQLYWIAPKFVFLHQKTWDGSKMWILKMGGEKDVNLSHPTAGFFFRRPSVTFHEHLGVIPTPISAPPQTKMASLGDCSKPTLWYPLNIGGLEDS